MRSRRLWASYIGPEHVLLALARDDESEAGELLGRFRTLAHEAQGAVMRGVDTATGAAREPASATPTLDEYSRDLTQMAREGKLDPVIGRAEEVETTIEILSRRTKNNPVLIGDPGVGKTAIVEGLAQRIVNDEVPETLVGRRVLALDLSGLAGTQYRGQFEERLKKVVDEASENPEGQILFIDELYTVVGAGAAEGSMDASNMLKPALARGELHVVEATTVDEYRKNVEKDAALERRFQPVLVGEPSVDDTIDILRGLKDRYEAHHRVKITEEAIVAAAELSDRYVTDRFLPDKAIDLMDQASARVRLRSKTKPRDTKELEEEVARLGREKDQAVSAEDFGRAQELKGRVEGLRSELDGSRDGARRPVAEVTAEDIAEVVSRATGTPSPSSPRRSASGSCALRSSCTRGWWGTRPSRPLPRLSAGQGPDSRTPTARSAPSCSWVPRASARPSSPARWPRPSSGRGGDGAHRHERVPGAAHCEPPGWGPSRLRGLRGGRPAHRER